MDDAVQNDGIHTIVLQPGVKRCLMSHTAVKTGHARILHGRENRRHTAAGHHGMSQGSALQKVRALLIQITHRSHEGG